MPVQLTENAMSRIRTLLRSDGSPNAFFRIAVNGGGCQGFEYSMSVEHSAEKDDEVIENEDCVVRIDRASIPFLLGTKLDWIETLAEEKFQFTNPNAQSSCGCGVSFSV